MNIDITPLRLLRGHHADTGTTGSGCFLDVVSYLAGDTTVTHTPACVCPKLWRVLQRINDMFDDKERPALLMFVERAMLTGGADRATQLKRVRNIEMLGHRVLRSAWLDAPAPDGLLRMEGFVDRPDFDKFTDETIQHAVRDIEMGWASRRSQELILGFLHHVLPMPPEATAPAVDARARRLLELAAA